MDMADDDFRLPGEPTHPGGPGREAEHEAMAAEPVVEPADE